MHSINQKQLKFIITRAAFSVLQILRLLVIDRVRGPLDATNQLLLECRDQVLSKRTASTIVRRPASKENRSRGRNIWTTVATRPSRPLDTVVLDDAQKEGLLADINEYLHPPTPRWYANRGIPYR